jgi:RNA polymerase sigma-70 factor (ECF subfamily)
MRESKNEMLKAAQSGDMDAFAALFEELRPMATAVARRLVGDSDADDVVMDSFLKAWKALPRFRSGSSLKTWLYRITYNCALDAIRKRSRHRVESLSAGTNGEPAAHDVVDATQRGPDEEIEAKDLALRVKEAMTQLSEEHSMAVQLRYMDGLSYREIAAATGTSIGTVMSRLFNGKRRLQKLAKLDG